MMPEEIKVTCHSRHAGTTVGPVWLIGWLFTIGFLKLTFGKGVLAIVLWPYYLGAFIHKPPAP